MGSVGDMIAEVRRHKNVEHVDLFEDRRIHLKSNGPVPREYTNALSDNKETVVRIIGLERRLATGYAKCEREQQAGRDTTAIDEFWIALLASYQQAYDTPETPRRVYER